MNESTVLSVSPVVLPAPGRPVELEVRVTAPLTGTGLPVILLSHGHGNSNHLSSLNGYGPLANFYAAQGFVVIQPTHLDSKTLRQHPGLDPTDHEAPLYWRSRAQDMRRILDRLDTIEAAVPTLPGRVDRAKVAVVGHSMGGQTASMLLGARGRGDALSDFAARNYGFFSTVDFTTMTTPALVVAGDKDASPHLTVAGPAWHTDPYTLSPAPKSLLTLFGAEHGLGGIAGYDAAETTDESPERVALVQRLTAAYLRSTLYPGDASWTDALATGFDQLGQVESR